MSDDRKHDHWVDVTAIGSVFQVEWNPRTGAYRHRPLKIGDVAMFEERGVGEWRDGEPKGN